MLKRFNFRSYITKKLTKHVVIIPAILTTIFFLAASLPVELFSCYVRVLVAVLLAVFAGILGIVAVVKSRIGGMR